MSHATHEPQCPTEDADAHGMEVERGERFAFGDNWRSFLSVLDSKRITEAEQSLVLVLGRGDLSGCTFLDIGSGSGLSSLVARRLGARVVSFDYDPSSVECTRELRRLYCPDDPSWHVEQGSVLDPAFMKSLGMFDVVYSWGVLHHTGDMWRALEAAGNAVTPGGLLFIAIYNDQGAWSRRWAQIKRFYCRGPFHRLLVAGTLIPYWVLRGLLADLFWGRNPRRRYTDYSRSRGMSVYYDWLDWLGGYPFEVAKPEQLFDFYASRGFILRRMVTAGGSVGCNEMVFQRDTALEPAGVPEPSMRSPN